MKKTKNNPYIKKEIPARIPHGFARYSIVPGAKLQPLTDFTEQFFIDRNKDLRIDSIQSSIDVYSKLDWIQRRYGGIDEQSAKVISCNALKAFENLLKAKTKDLECNNSNASCPPSSRPKCHSIKKTYTTNELISMPYDEYLKTEHWITIRNRELEKSGHRCRLCNSPVEVVVHHRSYHSRGTKDEHEDLVTLCRKCHRKFHDIKQ